MSQLLTSNAQALLKARYYRDGEDFKIFCHRVSHAIAIREKSNVRKKWENKFFKRLNSLEFLPNTPTLVNAGKKNGQLSACFVLPIERSLSDVMDALKNAALIHQSGGGTGFSFDRAGKEIRAVSVIDVLELFDKSTDLIKQGGVRRGANMGVLSVGHPEVLAFIRSKSKEFRLQNFNISVAVDNAFMNESLSNLKSKSGKLLLSISENAWLTGDPGLIFIDRMNLFNPTPKLKFEATNPCGEQPLLPFESCNLGSINLLAFVRRDGFDWEAYKQCIWDSVRFLDNVIDVNEYPIKKCEDATLYTRKIGLGIMGFADALLALGNKYNSPECFGFAEKVGTILQREARKASSILAQERGPFKAWNKSIWKALGFPKLRNATVTTIAPTGSISVIAGVSSGIEPRFSQNTSRLALDGNAVFIENVFDEMARFIEPQSKNSWRVLFETALDVPIEGHLQVQKIFQRYSDSAVSKTINMRNDAKIEDIFKAYRLAFEMGCKGITVFRDGCREAQILNKIPEEGSENSFGISRIRCESC